MNVSIIICCYNEEPILIQSWHKIRDVLQKFQNDKFEIIFVNDGSNDNTLKLLNEIKKDYSVVKLISHEINRGYGFALKRGFESAAGDVIITCDADLAMDISEVVASCLHWINNGKDMVVCSRYRGIKPDYPLLKRIVSWTYRTLNKILFKIPFGDTQSGFLGIKKKALEDIKLKSDDYTILLELIVKAHKNKCQIEEVAVKFIHDTLSGETSIWKAGPKMFKNTLKVWLEIR